MQFYHDEYYCSMARQKEQVYGEMKNKQQIIASKTEET